MQPSNSATSKAAGGLQRHPVPGRTPVLTTAPRPPSVYSSSLVVDEAALEHSVTSFFTTYGANPNSRDEDNSSCNAAPLRLGPSCWSSSAASSSAHNTPQQRPQLPPKVPASASVTPRLFFSWNPYEAGNFPESFVLGSSSLAAKPPMRSGSAASSTTTPPMPSIPACPQHAAAATSGGENEVGEEGAALETPSSSTLCSDVAASGASAGAAPLHHRTHIRKAESGMGNAYQNNFTVPLSSSTAAATIAVGSRDTCREPFHPMAVFPGTPPPVTATSNPEVAGSEIMPYHISGQLCNGKYKVECNRHDGKQYYISYSTSSLPSANSVAGGGGAALNYPSGATATEAVALQGSSVLLSPHVANALRPQNLAPSSSPSPAPHHHISPDELALHKPHSPMPFNSSTHSIATTGPTPMRYPLPCTTSNPFNNSYNTHINGGGTATAAAAKGHDNFSMTSPAANTMTATVEVIMTEQEKAIAAGEATKYVLADLSSSRSSHFLGRMLPPPPAVPTLVQTVRSPMVIYDLCLRWAQHMESLLQSGNDALLDAKVPHARLLAMLGLEAEVEMEAQAEIRLNTTDVSAPQRPFFELPRFPPVPDIQQGNSVSSTDVALLAAVQAWYQGAADWWMGLHVNNPTNIRGIAETVGDTIRILAEGGTRSVSAGNMSRQQQQQHNPHHRQQQHNSHRGGGGVQNGARFSNSNSSGHHNHNNYAYTQNSYSGNPYHSAHDVFPTAANRQQQQQQQQYSLMDEGGYAPNRRQQPYQYNYHGGSGGGVYAGGNAGMGYVSGQGFYGY